ncbi:MAG: hypothetical protein KDD66_00165 [Bdellovibrionales bacterium]|nr:hypothetical protein [Bdellovibrionales bacterium]
MDKYQIVYAGENRELSFVCEHCSSTSHKLTYDTYNRLQESSASAGECPNCKGTGFRTGTADDICSECQGTGLCRQCQGKCAVSWLELPRSTRRKWMSRWERHGSFPTHYMAVASLYRNW